MTIIDIKNPLYDPLEIFQAFKESLGLNLKDKVTYFRNRSVEFFVEEQIWNHKNFDKPKNSTYYLAVELLKIWEQLGFIDIIKRSWDLKEPDDIAFGSSEICI